MFKLFTKLVVLSFILLGCSNLTKNLLKDPEVNIVDFKLTGITAESVAMDLKLNVKNPNPVPLNLDSVNYTLNLSGEKVTEGTFDKGISVPASGEGVVTVPLNFNFNSVGNLLSGFLNRSFKKDYELVGTAQVGFFSIPFQKKGEVNLAK